MMNKTIPAPFSKGVNFTNWLEYRSAEKIDPDWFGYQDFANAKSLGCDVIRLPIHFECICNAENGYTIPKKVLDILDRVVSWAEKLGLYIILDFHNSTHVDSCTRADVEEILTPVWTQLATRYKEASDYVVYEIMNEPHGIEIPLWNAIVERVFRLIRSIDGRHWIIVGGADWNSTAAMKTLPDFHDDRVIYTFHFYDPHTFTHQGAIWCHMERVTGIPFPYDAEKMPPLPENPTDVELKCFAEYPQQGTLQKVEDCFDQYVAFSQERHAPVYCGEFGCHAVAVSQEQRINWYRIVSQLLDERGIARTSWDYYGSFGLFQVDWKAVKDFRKLPRPRFPEDLNHELLQAMKLG